MNPLRSLAALTIRLRLVPWTVPLIALASVTSRAEPAAAPDAPFIATLNVSPLRIEIGKRARLASFQIQNASAKPVALQVRVFAWSQQDGADQYVTTKDIIASPGILAMEPDAFQTFRVVRLNTPESGKELSYRIVIDQLPDRQQKAGAATTRLRLILPLFLDGDVASASAIGFAAQNGALMIANQGGKSARLERLSLKYSDGRVIPLDSAGPRYVLAGSTIKWRLPAIATCLADGSAIVGVIDSKPVNVSVKQICS